MCCLFRYSVNQKHSYLQNNIKIFRCKFLLRWDVQETIYCGEVQCNRPPQLELGSTAKSWKKACTKVRKGTGARSLVQDTSGQANNWLGEQDIAGMTNTKNAENTLWEPPVLQRELPILTAAAGRADGKTFDPWFLKMSRLLGSYGRKERQIKAQVSFRKHQAGWAVAPSST
jgi:hypothetical protein